MDNFPNGTYAGFVKQQENAEATVDQNQAENSDEEDVKQKELELE